MNRKIIFMLAITAVFSLVVGCTASSNDNELEEKIKILESENQELENQLNSISPNPNMTLLQTSLEVMELVKDKNMTDLSNYVHPTKGIRFTPYFYVDIQNDQVFTSQQVSNLDQDTTVYNWGTFDGIGDPIDLEFNDYYDRFIYDKDYIDPHLIGNNTAIGTGNTTDNVVTAYPDGEFVEFHFTGFDPQYSGIDWRSLRLVFEQHSGSWYLVGIIHGEWTI